MISEQYIIEIKTNKFSVGTGKVTFVTLIASLEEAEISSRGVHFVISQGGSGRSAYLHDVREC